MSQAPPTRSKRLFRIAGMTASVAGTYAASRVKRIFQGEEAAKQQSERAQAQVGEKIAATLGQLKGAAMKLGQMAHVAGELLPPELQEALRKLQREAEPVDVSVIYQQIEACLGSPADKLFAHFDPTAFASASIGQVHRARLHDGREVVVKVQYPGVDEAVDSDLDHLRLAMRASGLIKVSAEKVDEILDEMRLRLYEELDYRFEARQYAAFRELIGADKGFVLPEVIEELSGEHVLTTVYEPSDPIDRLRTLGYTQEQLDRLGTRLAHWVFAQVFQYGFLHADPHPGNLGARRDGRLVLYDFGCVKRLDPVWLASYRRLLVAGFAQDYAAVEAELQKVGVRKADRPAPDFSYYAKWRDLFVLPFTQEAIVDFSKIDVHRRALELTPLTLKNIDLFQPAREFIFLDRTLVGQYGNLRLIGARVPVFDVVCQYIPELREVGSRS